MEMQAHFRWGIVLGIITILLPITLVIFISVINT